MIEGESGTRGQSTDSAGASADAERGADIGSRTEPEAGPDAESIRVGLVCEAGGPLTQLRLLADGLDRDLDDAELFYVTYRTATTEDLEGHLLPKRYQRAAGGLVSRPLDRWTVLGLPFVVALVVRLAWILLRERPDAVVSTGDLTVAGPSFVVARLLGVRTIYVEDVEQFDAASRRARVLAPLSDRLLVQHPDALADAPECAEYRGGIL